MNPRFTGRQAALDRLGALLDSGAVALIGQTSGQIATPGGVGKSQLALEYAWRRAGDYTSVSWLDAAGRDITAELAAAAQPLGLRRREDEPAVETATAVRHHLDSGGLHLLVLDGVDHPWSYLMHLPAPAHTHVVLTSRRRDLKGCTPLLLELPLEHEAVALLGGEQPHVHALVEVLGRLPVSLDLAGRVLEGGALELSVLLKELRYGVVVWAHGVNPGPWFTKNPALARLCELTLALLGEDSTAGAMARVAGWFGGGGIPIQLLADAARAADPEATGDPALAIDRLSALGLASLDVRGRPVFHDRIRAWSRRRSGAVGAECVRDALTAALQAVTPDRAPAVVERLRPHLYEAVRRLDAAAQPAHMLIPLRLSQALCARGINTAALRVCKRALSSCEDDAWSAHLLHQAGQAMHRQGSFDRARALYKRSLGRAARSLGPDHPSVAVTLRAAGESLLQQDKPARACDYFVLALGVIERSLGPEHPDAAGVHYAIGQAWLRRGDSGAALAAFERALAVAEAAESPQLVVASALHAMGLAHRQLAQHSRAAGCFERAAAFRADALGPMSPITAASLGALGQSLHQLGVLDRAKIACDRALAAMRQSAGDAHPDTAILRFEHGRLIRDRGDPTGWQEMRDAAASLKALLGPDHPLVRTARSWLD